MNDNILFSIIIPVYNVEKLLPECLDSIVEQDFPTDEYEVICVNDGSPDNSKAILEEYAKKYNNIRVINKENGGISSARYVGYKEAKGQYIWNVDSDDFIAPEALKILKNELIKNDFPDRIGFKFYLATWNGTDTKDIFFKNIDNFNQSYGEAMIWTSIYKKEILKINSIPEKYAKDKISFSEDTFYNFLFMLYRNTNILIDVPLYFYRQNQNSITHIKNIKKEIKRANDYFLIAYEMQKAMNDYEKKNYKCKKSDIAYIYMCREWILFELLACLPVKYSIGLLYKSYKNNLFPIKIPDSYSVSKENTLKWAYGKTKTEKYLNCHCHTIYGFLLMWIYYTPIRIKTAIKRLIKK